MNESCSQYFFKLGDNNYLVQTLREFLYSRFYLKTPAVKRCSLAFDYSMQSMLAEFRKFHGLDRQLNVFATGSLLDEATYEILYCNPGQRIKLTIAMGGCIRSAFWFLPFLFFHALVFAEEDCTLQFVKGPERTVVANVYDDILSIALSEREMEGTLLSFGKAHRLSDKLLDKLKAKDPQLYKRAQKITSALKIEQGNNEFYLERI